MHRCVVQMLALVVVSSPLLAQEPPRDTTKKPAAVSKPTLKVDSAGGDVVKRDSARANKDARGTAKDSATVKDSAAAKDAAQPTAGVPQPTYRCKDKTISFAADSTEACGQRGGVDSTFAKPKPKP